MRANGDSPVDLAMTHMRLSHGQSAYQSTGCTQSVVLCVGGLRAWPIDKCSNKDAGKREPKTLTPCGTDRQRDRQTETHVNVYYMIMFFLKRSSSFCDCRYRLCCWNSMNISTGNLLQIGFVCELFLCDEVS